MRILRFVIVLAMLAALAATTLLRPEADTPADSRAAYAAGPSLLRATDRLAQSGNGNGDDEDDDEDDEDNNENEGDENENQDEDFPDDFFRRPAPPATPTPPNRLRRVLRADEDDTAQLVFSDGTAVVTVRPLLPLPEDVTISLAQGGLSPVSDTPGPRLDPLLFNVTSEAGGDLLYEVTLTVSYVDSRGLNERNLTIALWDGSRWVAPPVQTAAPDYNTISATINRTGTYAVYQR